MLGKLRGGQLNVGLAEREGAARFHPRASRARMPAQSTCPRAGSALSYSLKTQPLRGRGADQTRAWNEAQPDSRLFVFAPEQRGALARVMPRPCGLQSGPFSRGITRCRQFLDCCRLGRARRISKHRVGQRSKSLFCNKRNGVFVATKAMRSNGAAFGPRRREAVGRAITAPRVPQAPESLFTTAEPGKVLGFASDGGAGARSAQAYER